MFGAIVTGAVGMLIYAIQLLGTSDLFPHTDPVDHHPGLTATEAIRGYELAEPHDPFEQVTRTLGPGYSIPPAEWSATMFRTDPGAGPARFAEPGAMSLKQFSGQQPGDEVAVLRWYQWGSGPSRLFYATYRGRRGEERVFAKVIDHAAGDGHHVARTRYPYRRVAGGAVVVVRELP